MVQWPERWTCNLRAPSSSPAVTAGFVLGSAEFKAASAPGFGK